MLKNGGRSGGPEEDRTPDLLIANDVAASNINYLRHRNNAINSLETGGECTNWAQCPFPLAPSFVAEHTNGAPYSRRRETITARGPG